MLEGSTRRALTFIFALVMLAPWATAEHELPLVIPVSIEGLAGFVTLHPADPRSADLAAARPHVADGLYVGTLTNGARLHLAWRGGESLGLLWAALHPIWVAIEQGALVALPDEPIEAVRIDDEPLAPAQAPALAPDPDADGKLQLMLDMDNSLYRRVGEANWEFHQLAAAHLAQLAYNVQLGVEWEIVQQHAWDVLDPFQRIGGDPSCGELAAFRTYWESVAPTTSDPREDAHLMEGTWEGSFVGCGYPASLESSAAYSLSKFYLGTATGPDLDNNAPARLPSRTQVLLMAHEIGHNFGGTHGRAAPTPGGPLDPFLFGLPSPGILAGTIMYPILLTTQSGVLSDCPAQCSVLQGAGVMRDGGNAGFMRAHAMARI